MTPGKPSAAARRSLGIIAPMEEAGETYSALDKMNVLAALDQLDALAAEKRLDEQEPTLAAPEPQGAAEADKHEDSIKAFLRWASEYNTEEHGYPWNAGAPAVSAWRRFLGYHTMPHFDRTAPARVSDAEAEAALEWIIGYCENATHPTLHPADFAIRVATLRAALRRAQPQQVDAEKVRLAHENLHRIHLRLNESEYLQPDGQIDAVRAALPPEENP